MKKYYTVILTNPKNNIEKLAKGIQELGVKTILMPMVNIESILIKKNDLEKLNISEWIIITSKNAFKHFNLALNNFKFKLPSHIKIASVGKLTAAYIEQSGYTVNFISTGNTGEDFAKEFVKKVKSKQLFFPRGNISDPNTLNILKKYNNVCDVKVYKTNFLQPESKKISDQVKCKSYDFIVFTSPSAVDSFMNYFNDESIKTLSIGPTTTKKLKEYNINPLLQSSIPGYDGIIQELKNYYQ